MRFKLGQVGECRSVEIKESSYNSCTKARKKKSELQFIS